MAYSWETQVIVCRVPRKEVVLVTRIGAAVVAPAAVVLASVGMMPDVSTAVAGGIAVLVASVVGASMSVSALLDTPTEAVVATADVEDSESESGVEAATAVLIVIAATEVDGEDSMIDDDAGALPEPATVKSIHAS